jgi:hypothetical protein
MNKPSSYCPDCDAFNRRDFLRTTIGVAAASTLGGLAPARAQDLGKGKSETLVATLFKSLSEEQRKLLCFPFDHPLRSKVNNNWMINKPQKEMLNADQQAMVREIFLGLHSPEYAPRVMEQVVHDSDSEGFDGGTSVALFGEPGVGKFEFVLAGRHVTRRCDGDSVEGTAFGGPIFYGHAAHGFNEAADHPDNIYWYQAKRANEVYQMLDGKQREIALLGDGRPEKENDTVKLSGKTEGLPGIGVSQLSADQKAHVRQVMADVLAPFRKADADEALKLIEASGFDNLHLSFYKNQDIGNDGVWDVWQIEGPTMVWYFRGKPHVHVWVNVRASA